MLESQRKWMWRYLDDRPPHAKRPPSEGPFHIVTHKPNSVSLAIACKQATASLTTIYLGCLLPDTSSDSPLRREPKGHGLAPT